MQTSELQIRGKPVQVPTAQVQGREVAVVGRWLRMAIIKDEDWLEAEPIADPPRFVSALGKSGLRADLLTFTAGLAAEPMTGAGIQHEYDNAAVIRTDDFQGWWDGLPQEARKNSRRALKKGIEIRTATLDDSLVAGIKTIYDETPLRQGRAFWHYGKDAATVKRENSTYLERSEFLCAYFAGQLVGFMKLVYVGEVARIMQILCLNTHQDKRPIVALITKAADVCHHRGIRYLIYARFTYGRKSDGGIVEFKRRLGFEQKDFPRYYVPLTFRGRIALRLGAHRGWLGVLPPRAISYLGHVRAWWTQMCTHQVSGGTLAADAGDGR